MGLFDDAVPGGSIAKPLMIALGALLAGKMMGGFSQPDAAAPTATRKPPAGGLSNVFQGGAAMGGLNWLLERFKSAGLGNIANSWVSRGPNETVEPRQLGTALGQTTVAELARHAGMTEPELLAQLSRVLPNVVDKLTPQGRVPDQAEVASHFNG